VEVANLQLPLPHGRARMPRGTVASGHAVAVPETGGAQARLAVGSSRTPLACGHGEVRVDLRIKGR